MEIDEVKKYFENKNWMCETNDVGIYFYKKGTDLNNGKQIVDFRFQCCICTLGNRR